MTEESDIVWLPSKVMGGGWLVDLRTKKLRSKRKTKIVAGGGAEGLEPSRIEAEALIKCRRHPLAGWGNRERD